MSTDMPKLVREAEDLVWDNAQEVPYWSRLSVTGLGILALGLVLFPFFDQSRFTLILLTQGLIFGIWAMSLDLLAGYTGLVSFGHAAWFGLGAYVAGYFAREYSSEFLLSLPVALLFTLVIAAMAGYLVVQISGHAVSMLTLAISQLFWVVAQKWQSVTGGEDGLAGIPEPSFFGKTLDIGPGFYWLTVFIFLTVLMLLRYLMHTPYGCTLAAIRENAQRAGFIGINVKLHKWVAFILASLFAAVGGVLFAYLKGSIAPIQLYWSQNGIVLMMAVVGGLGTLVGPGLAGIVWVFLQEKVTSLFTFWQIYFGIAFVLVVLFLPGGVGGFVSQLWSGNRHKLDFENLKSMVARWKLFLASRG